MVDYWIQALLGYIGNFVGFLFNLTIIQYNNWNITFGQTCLYFALAGIILRFIFNGAGNMRWFEKE